MRVGLYTWGSEGDVRPFVALALGLSRAGHDVRLGYVAVDGRDYGGLAAPIAARAVGVAEIASARATGGAADAALAGKGTPLQQIREVLEHLLDPAVSAMWDDAAETIAGCDVVVSHLLHHPASALALAHRIPLVTVQPAPVHPTRHLPPMGAPNLGPLNALLWWVANRVGRTWFVPRFNGSRERAGVPLLVDMFPRPDRDVALALTCVSPSLVPRPADWEDSQRIPGFFEIPSAHASQGVALPADLERFLGAGEPPVLMGFGSMLSNPSEDTRFCVRVMLEAAELSGRRALVQAPWDFVNDAPSSDAKASSPNVFRLGRVPHALVLPRCAAFVHHGGAGTTHTACLAGTPSVVVPFLGDQFFWASRLRALGVAPAPVPRRALTAKKLAKQIRAVVGDAGTSTRARELARAMSREDGVGQAVRWIEEVPASR
ncbi:MAG: glycosyltransferase [Polyangiaceae bacterium]